MKKKSWEVTTLTRIKKYLDSQIRYFFGRLFRKHLHCGLGNGKHSETVEKESKWIKKKKGTPKKQRYKEWEQRLKSKNERKLICFVLERVTLFCFQTKSNHNLSHCRCPHFIYEFVDFSFFLPPSLNFSSSHYSHTINVSNNRILFHFWIFFSEENKRNWAKTAS